MGQVRAVNVRVNVSLVLVRADVEEFDVIRP